MLSTHHRMGDHGGDCILEWNSPREYLPKGATCRRLRKLALRLGWQQRIMRISTITLPNGNISACSLAGTGLNGTSGTDRLSVALVGFYPCRVFAMSNLQPSAWRHAHQTVRRGLFFCGGGLLRRAHIAHYKYARLGRFSIGAEGT